MFAKINDRNDLIAILRWQFDMGINEALLDSPDASAQRMGLGELLAPKNATMNIAADTPAAPITDATWQEKRKPPIAKNGVVTNKRALASPTFLCNINNLRDLKVGLSGLDDCPLKHTASNLCFADGNSAAHVMIIGEVPDRDEDRMGVPFVGKPGQLLDKMLASIGLDRASTYLTNLLPWRPPGNRTPTDEELARLIPWLFRHVQLANPDLVLLLGGATAKIVFDTQEGILKLRGKWRDTDYGDGVTRPTLASLHPAYLLRSPGQKRLAFDDLLMLANRLTLFAVGDKSS